MKLNDMMAILYSYYFANGCDACPIYKKGACEAIPINCPLLNSQMVFKATADLLENSIPIEWIKKWCNKEHNRKSLEERLLKRYGVLTLLEDWEKENEIDNLLHIRRTERTAL